MPEPYTIADLQRIVTAMKAADDDPQNVGPLLIDQHRMIRTLLEAIRDLRQRVTALENP